jgi:ABC-2 type transport system ATP-binding protein
VLAVREITKRFRNTLALDHVSFSVKAGTIVGFVGPNGAGKTTMMRAIVGITATDSGSITIDDKPLGIQSRRVIGYMPEERGLYQGMRVRDLLSYFCQLGGGDPSSEVEPMLERVDLLGKSTAKVESLSLGNQQRLQLAVALIGNPRLLVLDEPFSGIDPVALERMRGILRERAASGAAVLFSSHQLELVEELCDAVIIINRGRVLADKELATVQRSSSVRLRYVEHPSRDIIDILGTFGATRFTDDCVVEITLSDPAKAGHLLDVVLGHGGVRDFHLGERPLTETFRTLIGEDGRDEE